MSNTKHHIIVVTRDPLSREDATKARRIEGGAAYVRMCALGVGVHRVSTHELRRLTVSSSNDAITDILFKFRCWQQAKSPFFAVVSVERYGRLLREAITVQLNHLEEFDHTQYQQQPDVENTGAVLARFLFEFKQVMKTRADVDWDEKSGIARGLGKKILSLAGGYDAAMELLKAYILMPPEHRGDDLSFKGFWQNIPGILNLREMTAREEFEQRNKTAAWQARQDALPKTPEEVRAMAKRIVERAREENGEMNG